MTEKEKTLQAAEDLVRAVLAEDLKQDKIPAKVVRDVAKKVAKAIPQVQHREKQAA